MTLDLSQDNAGLEPTEAEVVEEAMALLGAWRRYLIAASHWAGDTSRAQGLATLDHWYEQVYADPTWAGTAPVEGIDALADELAGAASDGARDDLAHARWAVRVAEELVHWRRVTAADRSLAPGRIAVSRLELALRGARRYAACR
jgi:hypothetical protein